MPSPIILGAFSNSRDKSKYDFNTISYLDFQKELNILRKTVRFDL